MKADQALHLVQCGEIRLDRGLHTYGEVYKNYVELVSPRVDAALVGSAKYPWARGFLERAALYSIRAYPSTRAVFTDYVGALVDLNDAIDDFYVTMVLEQSHEFNEFGELVESREVRRAREKARRLGHIWLKSIEGHIDGL